MYNVSLVEYKAPYESLKKAVDAAGGLRDISGNSKVFIKPNFVVWFEGVNFPKFGVLTSARLIEDIVIILNEYGVRDVTIVEGITIKEESSKSELQYAIKGMGLDTLTKRYGVKLIDVHKESFNDVTVGDVTLSVNADILNADHIINMPVLKTHAQCIVSLGIKNLKGLLNIESRKICHNQDQSIDLDYHVSKLADMLSPSLTIIDGIYSLEYGPTPFGEAHRSDLIIVSRDMISADKVGATLLGYAPNTIPHIALSAKNSGRASDLSDIDIKGDVILNEAVKPHKFMREHSETNDIPLLFEAMGIKGVRLPMVDNTLCTYCVSFFAYAAMGILMAPNNDTPFDDIEILFGKILEPSGKHNHTLLLGQCQVKKNRKNPLINHCVKVKGCPPKREDFIKAYKELGIELPDDPIKWMDELPGFFAGQYADRSEFDELFYKI